LILPSLTQTPLALGLANVQISGAPGTVVQRVNPLDVPRTRGGASAAFDGWQRLARFFA